MRIDLAALQRVDAARREAVRGWLRARGLPVVDSGSYYVRAFRLDGEPPRRFAPLVRDRVLRLCMKPSHDEAVDSGAT